MKINNPCIRCDLREQGEIAGPCYEGCQRSTERFTWEPSGLRGRDGVGRVALVLCSGEVVVFEGDQGPDQRLGFVKGPHAALLAWCRSLGMDVR